LGGQPVRIGVLERAVEPPTNSREGAESELATEPEVAEVCCA
jgi:hypothetical protein